MKALLITFCFLFGGCVNYDRKDDDIVVNCHLPDPEPKTTHVTGEKLFKANCSACHRPGNQKLVGPGLADYGDSLTTAYKPNSMNHTQRLAKSQVDSIGKYIVDYRSCSGLPAAN